MKIDSTHLARGPDLLALWLKYLSTVAIFPLLAASMSSCSFPMGTTYNEQTAEHEMSHCGSQRGMRDSRLGLHFELPAFQIPAGLDSRVRTIRVSFRTWFLLLLVFSSFGFFLHGAAGRKRSGEISHNQIWVNVNKAKWKYHRCIKSTESGLLPEKQ